MSASPEASITEGFERLRSTHRDIEGQMAARVVAHEETIHCLIAGLFLNGHILLEGVPGLGKTMLARTLADAVSLKFSRVQFTPDLMPADILGTHIINEKPGGGVQLVLQRGPIFTNVLLADEINRASPKTQSAMLEAMQEAQVSLGNLSYPLEAPFFVVATQNPIESEGTYPLPDAQLDRFLMKLLVRFPTEEEVMAIVLRTTGRFEKPVEKVAGPEDITSAGRALRRMPIAEPVLRHAVQLVLATHPEGQSSPAMVKKYVRCGASPRAAQSIALVARFFAALDKRMNVSVADVQRAAAPCLRHRILRNFDAVADGVTTDFLISELLRRVQPPKVKG